MTASDELHKLTDKTKEAEQKAVDARQQVKADLEKAIDNTRASMQAQAAEVRESSTASERKTSSWWAEQQAGWNAQVDKMHRSMDERKVQHEAKAADREAKQAENEATVAIDFAYGAIEMAEYAVLYSILAREEADEAAAATAGAGRTH